MNLPTGSAELTLELLVTVLVRGTALVSIAWFLAGRIHQPEARRAVWIALFVGLAVSPLLGLRSPRVSLGLGRAPAAGTEEPVASTGARRPAPITLHAPFEPRETSTGPFVPDLAPLPAEKPTGYRIALLVWALGAGTLWARMGMVRRRLESTRAAADEPDDRIRRIAMDEMDRADIERPVRVLVARELALPASWGDRKPVVALPHAARRWPADCLRTVLRHELAHVRRRDALVLGLARAVRAAYWFNPLVWWATRQTREAQEQACDAFVLGSGVRRVDYARHLVEVVRLSGPRSSRMPEAALTIAPRERLERRVRSILEARPGTARPGLVATAAVVPILVAAALTGVQLEPARSQVVARALDGLTGREASVRRMAAERLGDLRDTRARPALERRLDDRDSRVREAAAAALGRIGEDASVRPLLGAVRDPDHRVRKQAVVALGTIADRRAFYELKPIALAGGPELSPPAIWALGEIQCFPAIGVLVDLLGGSDDPRARATAARGLRGAPAALAREPLVAALSNDPDATVRREAAAALGDLAYGRRSFERAIAMESATIRRRHDSRANTSGPERAIVALRSALSDPDPRIRSAAARSLDTLLSFQT